MHARMHAKAARLQPMYCLVAFETKETSCSSCLKKKKKELWQVRVPTVSRRATQLARARERELKRGKTLQHNLCTAFKFVYKSFFDRMLIVYDFKNIVYIIL